MELKEIQSKVDKIWGNFWTGGVTNPLTVIEQFTYLIFIKSLDDKQIQSEKESKLLGTNAKIVFDKENEELRWHNFREFEAAKMYDTVANKVFPFIKNLDKGDNTSFTKYMKDAMFVIPTPQMLQKVVTGIDNLEIEKMGDVKGDLYEYLLSKLSQAGTNGQFRTPRHISEMMVELVSPTLEDVIIDPACGTAGFLVAASKYIVNEYKEELGYSKKRIIITTIICFMVMTWIAQCLE